MKVMCLLFSTAVKITCQKVLTFYWDSLYATWTEWISLQERSSAQLYMLPSFPGRCRLTTYRQEHWLEPTIHRTSTLSNCNHGRERLISWWSLMNNENKMWCECKRDVHLSACCNIEFSVHWGKNCKRQCLFKPNDNTNIATLSFSVTVFAAG